MTVSVEQIVNAPILYVNNLQLSNDATTPNTKLDVAAGACRDSLNQMDIVLSSAVVVNFGVNGANGLDTGSIAASTVYYIYAIADLQGFKAPACIASTAVPSTGPLMPLGYGAQRWIGCCVTDGSSNILKAYWSGNNNEKEMVYDAPQATGITAGASNTYAVVDLSALVPKLNNTPVNVYSEFKSNAAADTLNLQPVNATGDAIKYIAQVAGATASLSNNSNVLAQIASSKPEINYKVSAGQVAIKVNSFKMSL